MLDSSISKYRGRFGMSIVNAMEAMDKNGRGFLLVLDDEDRLQGLLTDGDIRRWLIRTGNLDASIDSLINKNPKTLHEYDEDMIDDIFRKEHIKMVPVIDELDRVIRIHFNELTTEVKCDNAANALHNVPVVIMAGGKGTRLYPYTKILPKPLIPIGDKPIIEHIIDRFCEYGCKDFYIILNYKRNMIKAYFSDKKCDYKIHFVDEDKPLGTGGGLSLLRGIIHETFVLTNCDILIESDYSEILNFHNRNHNKITMICSLKNYTVPYGVVEFSEDGLIKKMSEKPQLSFFTNTGCYFLEPDIIDMVDDGSEVGFPEIIQKSKENGKRVAVYPIGESAWMDMGQLDVLEDMKNRIEGRTKA